MKFSSIKRTHTNRSAHRVRPTTGFHNFTESSEKSSTHRDPNVTLSSENTQKWNTKSHWKPRCNSRTGVIIFFMIVALVLGTAVALAIVFGVVNASKNGSGSNSANGNSVNTPASNTVTSAIVIGSQSGAPCSSYTSINDPTRNVNQLGSYGTCDNGPIFNASNGAAWIRFEGTGGTELALSAPGINHCGAFLPAYFNGTLPTTVNSMVNDTVCVETMADECGWYSETSVILCPDTVNFYIFLLQPLTVCKARYCTA